MECNKKLQQSGTSYPRTCEKCKLGPCTDIEFMDKRNKPAGPRASTLEFEIRYSDDSGVDKAVRLDGEDIEISAGSGYFEFSDIDWLIGCLERIRTEGEL